MVTSLRASVLSRPTIGDERGEPRVAVVLFVHPRPVPAGRGVVVSVNGG